jgi:RNA polymerase sigma-70 factor, ECF subfamily
MTDQELIQAFQEGRGQALADLLQRHKNVLYGYLLRMTRNPADAEDLFQECCLRLMKSLSSWEPRKPFRNLLFTIAGNLCIDRSRRNKVRQRHMTEEPADIPLAELASSGHEWLPDSMLEKSDLHGVLQEAVDQLPEASRLLVMLRLQTGMTFQEIADMRGEPIGTVLPRMHRALKSIRSYFKERGYDKR